MSPSASDPADAGVQRRAMELFLASAGPALVKAVAETLAKRGIPVMPLKGVLLQRLVYGKRGFRPISDVDLLVPEACFLDACEALRAAGFSETYWQKGGWQVSMDNPLGLRLGIDLHRRLTRTERSRLTSAGLFHRGVRNHHLFDAPVVLPCADDLFAHLLLHAALHWIKAGQLHRGRDFQSVAVALGLDPLRCAQHISRHGLVPHALLMLPKIAEEAGGAFIAELTARLTASARERAAVRLVRMITRFAQPGDPARRLAGLALAPSLTTALASALRDRLRAATVWRGGAAAD